MRMNLKKAAAFGLSTLGAIAGSAMAQTTPTIDVSGPTGQITAGLAAVATLGAAWVGFKYLKKVWNRI